MRRHLETRWERYAQPYRACALWNIHTTNEHGVHAIRSMESIFVVPCRMCCCWAQYESNTTTLTPPISMLLSWSRHGMVKKKINTHILYITYNKKRKYIYINPQQIIRPTKVNSFIEYIYSFYWLMLGCLLYGLRSYRHLPHLTREHLPSCTTTTWTFDDFWYIYVGATVHWWFYLGCVIIIRDIMS